MELGSRPENPAIIIECDGEWCLVLKDVLSSTNPVTALRSALSLDNKAALALLLVGVIFRGTRTESLWLGELLEAAGAHVELRQ